MRTYCEQATGVVFSVCWWHTGDTKGVSPSSKYSFKADLGFSGQAIEEASGKTEGKAAQLFREKQNSNFPLYPPANVPFNYVILREDCWGLAPRELAQSIIVPRGVGPTTRSDRHCIEGLPFPQKFGHRRIWGTWLCLGQPLAG